MGRILPGLFMAATWLLLLLFGSFQLFWCIVVTGAAIALNEYFVMTVPGRDKILRGFLIFFAALPVLFSYQATTASVQAGLVVGLLGTVLLVLGMYSRLENVFSLLCTTGFASLYIGFCTANLILLYALPGGASWIIVLTAITAGSDTGAYYAGRTLGKKKLCPHVSPGKTVAGAVGGILAGVVAAELIVFLLPISTPIFPLALVAVVLVVIGIIGDLLESVIKRAMQVKDSGTLLRGHGGILDRVDSLLLTSPVFYILLSFGIFS